MAIQRKTSSNQTLFSVPSGDEDGSGIAAVRQALQAVEHAPRGTPSISQRYSRAQTERARRGIALARQALDHAA